MEWGTEQEIEGVGSYSETDQGDILAGGGGAARD